jgi:hypothetical protein
MEKAIKTMVQKISDAIIKDTRDVFSAEGDMVLKMVLAAYNDFQESERDGVDYIFDIENTNDLKCCIDGGMTAKEIGGLYLGSHSQHLRYFYFGCNHPTPKPISTWETLRQQLVSWLSDLIPNVLAYPFAYESYRKLYERYVTDVIISYNNSTISLSDLDALKELKRKLEGMD